MNWFVRRGRLSRRDLWGQYLVPLFLLAVAATWIDSELGYSGASEHWYLFSFPAAPVSAAVTLLSLVPSVSSTVARLHDRGHSAWWLLWLLVPVVGWFLVLGETLFFRGEPVQNAYGLPEERTLAYA